MKKLKVVHIINNLEIGGAERVLVLLLRELAKKNDIDLTLISLEGHGPLEKEILKLGISYKKFNYRLFNPLFRRVDPYFRLSLFLYLRKLKPDLIHGHLIVGEDIAKVMGGILRVPVVTTLHDMMIKPGRKQRFLNRFLSRAVAVSQPVATHLRDHYHLPNEKIAIIPDAIDFKEYKNSKKEFNIKKPVFIYVGRLFKTKGIEYAIEGLAKLKKEYPKLKFLIYGKKVYQSDYDKWQTMIEKNGWDFVEFMGPTDDVSSALKSGDIFILPSKTEGFSMAVLEAAAASKPIIATKTGSIPQMLVEGENGYFVEYGSAEDIYTKAQKMLSQDILEFGEASYNLNKNQFSIQKAAEMYYNLYLELIRN